MDKKTVLFLCVRNSARSQIAEALLRHHAGDRFEAYSAGLKPSPVHPLTVRALAERGVDASGQQAKGVRQFLGRLTADYVIVVCEEAEQDCPRLWPGVHQRLSWPVEDPAVFEGDEEAQLEKFRAVCDQLEERILDWLAARGD